MSRKQAKFKKRQCKEHRRQELDRVLGLLIAGKTNPGHVHTRAEKLKAVSR